MPLVSVVIPAYNAARCIEEALESILAQTMRDLEVVVIDDGSVDGTGDRILGLGDRRIRCLRNARNEGVAASLNRGISIATGKYLARMDADDFSYPRRLEIQASFLQRHADYLGCGSWMRIRGTGAIMRSEPNAARLSAALLFTNQLFHPTVMLRSSILREPRIGYDESKSHIEDYDLWLRLRQRGKLTNIRQPLVLYRRDQGSVTGRHRAEQAEGATRLQIRELRSMGINPTEREVLVHACLAGSPMGAEGIPPREIAAWCAKLLRCASDSGYADPRAMRFVLRERASSLAARRNLLSRIARAGMKIGQFYLTPR